MARAAWKFTYVTDYDLCAYLKTYIKKTPLTSPQLNIRFKTFNQWNYKLGYFVPQGKYTIFIQPGLFHLNYKIGAFAKTRKPFFFRSKKKKK